MSERIERPEVTIPDWHPAAVLHSCRNAARRAGWTPEEFAGFEAEARGAGNDVDELYRRVDARFEIDHDYSPSWLD